MNIVFPLLCAISRATVTAIDRKMYSTNPETFFSKVFINNFLPFLLAILCTLPFFSRQLIDNILSSEIILISIAIQMAGYALASALKETTIKNLAIITKTSDLFIPFGMIILQKKYVLSDMFFSFITFLAFIPSILTIKNKKELFFSKIAAFVIGSLLFQSLVIGFYKINSCISLGDFLTFVTSVLFWRSIFSLLIFFYSNNNSKFNLLFSHNNGTLLIAGRTVLIFLGHMSFFISIYNNQKTLWPILNSIPFLSCVISHFAINEKLCKKDILTLFLFFSCIFGHILLL